MDNLTCNTEPFENWNPLEEAYYNPEFNSYASGPGVDLDHNLQIPLKEKVPLRTYKLYVKNIPLCLTERGLRNIFTHFGDPKSVHVGRSKYVKTFSWGLVEYDNLQSAQNAIIAIHFQPPYNLDVKFAMSEKEKERLSEEKKLKEKVCQPQSQSYKEKEDNTNEERAKIISVGLLPQTVSLSSYSNGGGKSTNDYVIDYTFFNHYSRECLCNSTHRLYSQLFFNYQLIDYHLIDNSSNTSQLSTPVSLLTFLLKKLDVETDTAQIAKPFYDNKNNGIYEYGDECDNFGKCQLCRATTLSSCKSCQAWYCGTKCLFKHWPEHKMSCSSLNLTNEINVVKNELTLNCRVPLVDVQKESNLLTSEETSSKSFVKPESITVFLKEGFTGLVQVRERLSGSKLLVTLVCSELSDSHKIFIDVPEIIAKLPFDESFIPEVGEVVGVECTQEIGVEWPRGYIYTERQAVLCDFGNVVKYTKVKKLSQQLIALPNLAVYCTLLEGNEFIQGDNELEFFVTKCKRNGCVEASFKNERNDDFIGKVMFIPLTYFSLVNIKNGSRVRLSAFYNCAAIYVQSTEPESVEVFEELMQDLGAHCQTEKSLNIEPLLGDLVAVRYSKDGNWYRGQLLKKENGNFQVIYVDFGNIETVPLTHMKSLNTYLKSIPCCAVRVCLTDIHPDTSLTVPALQLLTNLCESSEPLRIEFSNNGLNSVKLLRQEKLSLVEELKILIKPGWKKALERSLDPTGGQVFMMDDLINCLLTEGKEYQLRVLLLSPPNELTLCSTISDLSKHVISTLSSQLNEYCIALKSTSYNPRNGELCIVQLEEDCCWYRAVCLETLFTISKARVMFIDFGNICVVSHKNIRRFCEDFISTPAMTIMCNYEAIPETCTEVVIKRIEELIQPNNEITVLVKSLDENTLYYNIDIPSVTSVLMSEQLL